MRRLGNRESGPRRRTNPRDRAAALARKRALQLRLRPLLRIGRIVLLVVLVIGAPWWLWQSGLAGRGADWAGRSALAVSAWLGLSVQDILLEGRTSTPREQVVAAVGAKRGDPMIALDIAAMRTRLEAVPWIKSAVVERRYPDTLHVRIVERVPLALWQRGGRLMLVDSEGVVLDEENLGRYRDLLMVIGDDAPRAVPGLLAVLRTEPALAKKVVAATLVGTRRWNLRLDNGVDVRLPADNADAAWTRLAALDRQHKLLGRDVTTIDLRLPDRLILKPKDDVRIGRKGGKDA